MMNRRRFLEHARPPRRPAHTASLVTKVRASRSANFSRSSTAPGSWPSRPRSSVAPRSAHVGCRAHALKEAGIQRVHHNVETAESYYDEVATTVPTKGAWDASTLCARRPRDVRGGILKPR